MQCSLFARWQVSCFVACAHQPEPAVTHSRRETIASFALQVQMQQQQAANKAPDSVQPTYSCWPSRLMQLITHEPERMLQPICTQHRQLPHSMPSCCAYQHAGRCSKSRKKQQHLRHRGEWETGSASRGYELEASAALRPAGPLRLRPMDAANVTCCPIHT